MSRDELEELLATHGIEASELDALVAWARRRSAELVEEARHDAELGPLLEPGSARAPGGHPTFRRLPPPPPPARPVKRAEAVEPDPEASPRRHDTLPLVAGLPSMPAVAEAIGRPGSPSRPEPVELESAASEREGVEPESAASEREGVEPEWAASEREGVESESAASEREGVEPESAASGRAREPEGLDPTESAPPARHGELDPTGSAPSAHHGELDPTGSAPPAHHGELDPSGNAAPPADHGARELLPRALPRDDQDPDLGPMPPGFADLPPPASNSPSEEDDEDDVEELDDEVELLEDDELELVEDDVPAWKLALLDAEGDDAVSLGVPRDEESSSSARLEPEEEDIARHRVDLSDLE